ncbi:protein of unknown function [Methylorubrum extorquens]|uniref:Uncharacterized protein n=1 Tax=Methylorubrum extorquens TaxID=408 RepID=A0A2N9AXE7_METEX|nr:protein of unknown function [Methylorubrum extorquens]
MKPRHQDAHTKKARRGWAGRSKVGFTKPAGGGHEVDGQSAAFSPAALPRAQRTALASL